nr:MAG TPA: hypothetical protein [Caudoviricetes sp.]
MEFYFHYPSGTKYNSSFNSLPFIYVCKLI